MQLSLVFAVVAALVYSEHAPGEPVSGSVLRLALAAGALVVLGVVSFASSRYIAWRLTSDFDCRHRWLRQFVRLQFLHTGLWLLAVAGTLTLLGWPQVVRYNWQLRDAFLIDELLILLPVLWAVLLAWAASYEVDRAGEMAAAARWHRSPRTMQRGRYVVFHMRQQLGVVLLPLLLVLAVEDGLHLLLPEALESDYAWLSLLLPLAVVVTCFPLLLAWLWEARPLPDGPLRARLLAAAERWSIRPRGIYIWNTGGRMVNAAVAGFLPRLRYVFLSDALLQNFNDEEIEAVFAHEVGHIRGRHMLLRLLVIIAPPLLVGTLAGLYGNPFFQDLVLSESTWDGNNAVGIFSGVATAAYLVVVLGLYSRILEREADLFACTGREPVQPTTSAPAGVDQMDAAATATFVFALQRVAQVSGSPVDRGTWLHPSVRARVRFLRTMLVNPAARRRFAWLTRSLEVSLYAILVVAVVLTLGT